MDPETLREGAILLALAALGLFFGVRAWSDYLRGEPLVRYEPRRPVPWNAAHVGLWLLCYVVLIVPLALWTAPPESADTTAMLDDPDLLFRLTAVTAIANILAGGLLLLILRRVAGASWQDIGFAGNDSVEDIKLGIGTFCLIAAPIYAVQMLLTHWFPSEHMVQKLMERAEPRSMALAVISAVAVAPLCEELFFRSLLQGWLEKAFARWSWPPSAELAAAAPQDGSIIAGDSCASPLPASFPLDDGNPYSSPQAAPGPPPLSPSNQAWTTANVLSIVVSSAAFAMLHAWPDMVALFLFALALGFLYQRTHRLLPSIVLHACLNLTSVAMLLMRQTG